MNIGVAAHISAASPGGPRFDPSLSPKDRAGMENGIWLCQNCAKLTDNDPSRYPVALLQQWRAGAENEARSLLEKSASSLSSIQLDDLALHRSKRIAEWRQAIEAETYDFIDYRSTFLASATYASLRPYLLPDMIAKIEAPRTMYVGGARGDDVRKYVLLDEVARIEREWGLV